MSRRARHLSLYLAALAAGAAVAVALVSPAHGGVQPPPSASFTAENNHWYVTGTLSTTAAIAAGGSVTFTSPAGNNDHNASFQGAGPSSCDPPLPGPPTDAPWSSTCQFNTAGTYSFVCTAHPGMGGTVEVVAPGTPTTPPPTTEPGTPPPGGNPPGGGPGQPGSPTVKVPRRQRGTTVRGSVTTSVGGSRLVIRALVSNRLLATSPPRRVRKLSVGSLRRQLPSAGKTAFAVKLNRPARRALNRRDRLTVSLRITVTPPGGTATTKTAKVVLRPAS
jgi:plastocyanin